MIMDSVSAEDHKHNVELFLRMANFDKKPSWVSYLECNGISVSPRAYLNDEELKVIGYE